MRYIRSGTPLRMCVCVGGGLVTPAFHSCTAFKRHPLRMTTGKRFHLLPARAKRITAKLDGERSTYLFQPVLNKKKERRPDIRRAEGRFPPGADPANQTGQLCAKDPSRFFPCRWCSDQSAPLRVRQQFTFLHSALLLVARFASPAELFLSSRAGLG